MCRPISARQAIMLCAPNVTIWQMFSVTPVSADTLVISTTVFPALSATLRTEQVRRLPSFRGSAWWTSTQMLLLRMADPQFPIRGLRILAAWSVTVMPMRVGACRPGDRCADVHESRPPSIYGPKEQSFAIVTTQNPEGLKMRLPG